MFVRRNRPPEIECGYRLAMDDLDGVAPPDEGTISVSDGPSGCFSPGGAYEYYIRCSHEESYLAVARTLHPFLHVDPMVQNDSFDFRVVPLRYQEARQLLQVGWWLDRIRSKKASDRNGGVIGSSTGDGEASFRVEWAGGKIEFAGTRYDHYPTRWTRWIGVDQFCGEYTRLACLNLIDLLICDRLPAYLGERWRNVVSPRLEWTFGIPQLTDYRPEENEALKKRLAETLSKFRDGKFNFNLVREAVWAIGELGMVEMKDEVERLGEGLPAPSAREKRLGEIAAQLEKWQQKLGPEETSYRAHSDRVRQLPAEQGPIPGLGPTAPSTGIQQVPPDPKFAEFDALYDEQFRLERELPLEEKGLAALRAQITSVVEWLAVYNDPAALERKASIGDFRATCRRLRELDPRRALKVLEQAAGREKNDAMAQPILKMIDELRYGVPRGDEESGSAEEETRRILRLTRLPEEADLDAQAKGLIKVALNGRRALGERAAAIALLVPSRLPTKFAGKEVEEALMQMSEPEKKEMSELWPKVCEALARRGGGKYWDRIASLAGKTDSLGRSNLERLLPSLAYIARREPNPYRGKFHDLIVPASGALAGASSGMIWMAWLADLREIQPLLKRLAAAEPDGVEAKAVLPEGSSSSFTERLARAARQVLSLWEEGDTVTRAKLLIAAGLEQDDIFSDDLAAERLLSEFRREVGQLNEAEKEEVKKLLTWCNKELPSVYLRTDYVATHFPWLVRVNATMGGPIRVRD